MGIPKAFSVALPRTPQRKPFWCACEPMGPFRGLNPGDFVAGGWKNQWTEQEESFVFVFFPAFWVCAFLRNSWKWDQHTKHRHGQRIIAAANYIFHCKSDRFVRLKPLRVLNFWNHPFFATIQTSQWQGSFTCAWVLWIHMAIKSHGHMVTSVRSLQIPHRAAAGRTHRGPEWHQTASDLCSKEEVKRVRALDTLIWGWVKTLVPSEPQNSW